jgi:hypothetical protein
MSSKVKSALILLGTLALGMALGAMLWTALHTRQMEKIRSLRENQTLTDTVVDVVDPVDEAQLIMVEAAVATYQERMSSVYHEHSRARRAATDWFRDQLSEFLNASQQENFDDWLSRMRRGPRASNRTDSTNTNKD